MKQMILMGASLFLFVHIIGQAQTDPVSKAESSDPITKAKIEPIKPQGGGAIEAAIITKSEASLSPALLDLRREANFALYNVDYVTARDKFEEIRKIMPNHPAGDIYVATTIWLEYLYKNRRLHVGLYKKDSNFYAGAEDTSEDTEGDDVDPEVDEAFRERMASAKTKAMTLVAKNKNDADALYFLGAYYGVMAAYEASTARKFFAAMRNGSRCVDAHKKVIKLKPDYHDAYLSIGTYDYIVGSLPFAFKAIGTLAGFRGNKERGIQNLEMIVQKEAFTADDARVLLLAIYQNEKRYDDSLVLLKQLNEKYPKSYLLRLETASTLVLMKRTDEAYKTFDALLNDPGAGYVGDLANYKYAEALAQNSEYKRSAEHFQSVSTVKNADGTLVTLSMLRAGQMLDLTGQRNDAVSQYKLVLARPNAYDSKEQAEKGIKQAYKQRQ